jgi:hypothetical protein
VLAIVLIRGGLFQPSQQNIQRDACRSALVQSSACYQLTGEWNNTGYAPGGSVASCNIIAQPTSIPGAQCSAADVAGSYMTLGTDRFYCCGARPS